MQMMGDEFPLIIPVWCITEGKKKKEEEGRDKVSDYYSVW